LQVHHDGYGHTQPLGGVPQSADSFSMLLMGSMGKIQSGDVHAGLDQRPHPALIFGSWADRGDDFCASFHKVLLYYLE
jgi:hypothetical protein